MIGLETNMSATMNDDQFDDNISEVSEDETMESYIREAITYKNRHQVKTSTVEAILTHITAANIFWLSTKCLDFKYDNGDWWAFHRGLWHKDDKAIRIRRSIAAVLTEHLENTAPGKIQQKNVLLAQNMSFLSGVAQAVSQDLQEPNFEGTLDLNGDLVGFPGGCVFDVQENAFRTAVRDDLISKTTKWEYREPTESEVANLNVFLMGLVSDGTGTGAGTDTELLTYLLMLLSATTFSVQRIHQFVNIFGVASNGKSKLTFLMMKLLGDYFKVIPFECLSNSNSNGDAASPHLAGCGGVRMLCSSEPETTHKIGSVIKKYSGGDEYTTRANYGNPKTFTVTFHWYVLSNGACEFKSVDAGIKRRSRQIEFETEFVDVPEPTNPRQRQIDANLDSKMAGMVPALFKLLLHYLPMVKACPGNSIQPIPDRVLLTSSDRTGSDHTDRLQALLETNCTSINGDEDTPSTISEIYNLIPDWWKISRREMENNMTLLGYNKVRETNGPPGTRDTKRCWKHEDGSLLKKANLLVI